jgi:NodT family efflux transporter outer membrane factor (OMF) lipoprotein
MLRHVAPLALLAAFGLPGCALQSPPPRAALQADALPNLAVPAAYTAHPLQATNAQPLQVAQAQAARDADRARWLDDFADPALTALVREALAYNTDLRAAAARIELAAAQARLAGSTLYPAVNLIAHGGGKSGGDGSGVAAVGLFANWELDLWGRVRYGAEAGRLGYDAAVLDAQYARQSIAAGVVKSWLLAVQAHLQRAVADDVVRAAEQFTGLAQDRLRVGRGDEYDVSLAQANLATARDAARQIALAEEQALRAVETLVGRYPAAALAVPAALPAMPGPVPVGLPSELLERRPDVVAAERRVAAAFNQVGEAKAARLPRIALTASVSSVSSELFVLKSHPNPAVSLGANLIAPLFTGHALEAQVEIRTAEQALAVADYGRIASRAFSDVEAALSAAFAADEREAILADSVQRNARALELAQVRFRVGSGDLRAVLQQSLALLAVRTTFVQVQAERRVQRVNVYLAVGGAFVPAADGSTLGAAATPERMARAREGGDD